MSADDPANGTQRGYNDFCPVFFIQKFMFWSVFFHAFSSLDLLFLLLPIRSLPLAFLLRTHIGIIGIGIFVYQLVAEVRYV